MNGSNSNRLGQCEASCEQCEWQDDGPDIKRVRQAARYHAHAYHHITTGHYTIPFEYTSTPQQDGRVPR